MNNIILTGALGGMGKEIVKLLTSQGYEVYGLDILNVDLNIEHFHYYQVDLTDINSVRNVYNKISQEISEVDALILTAGIYDLNSLVEMSEEDFIRIFNINVFANYRMNKIFLPLLKKKGKIIMVSSELAPLDPLPFTGIYALTKTTIEKYAYALRMELNLLDYQVVIIRPGAIDTSLINVSTSKLDKFCSNTSLYKTNSKRFQDIVNKVEAKKIPPIRIAYLTSKILKKKRPRYVYKMNRNPWLLILNVLPQRLQTKIITRILKTKD